MLIGIGFNSDFNILMLFIFIVLDSSKMFNFLYFSTVLAFYPIDIFVSVAELYFFPDNDTSF